MKRFLAFFLFTLSVFAQSSGVGSNWTVVTGSLQSAAVANGNGTALAVQGLSSMAVTVNCSVACSGGTTVTFQGSQDGTNYSTLSGLQAGTTTIAGTVVNQGTTPTVWYVNVFGLQLVRAVISAYSAGTITVTASAVGGSPSHTAVNIANAPVVHMEGNAGAIVDGVPGSAVPANALQIGLTDGTNTRVPYVDPCAFNAWTYTPINITGNTQIVAGSSGKNVYVCKMFIAPVAAAANVNIVESATSSNACATSPTGMLGGATAALGSQLSTNGGFVLPSDNRAWAKTATVADAVCIFTSAQITGVIATVQF